MLRAELQTRRPLAKDSIAGPPSMSGAGGIAGAVRCLLAAGDTDRAFSLVFEAAHYQLHADLAECPKDIAAFINLFPLK